MLPHTINFINTVNLMELIYYIPLYIKLVQLCPHKGYSGIVFHLCTNYTPFVLYWGFEDGLQGMFNWIILKKREKNMNTIQFNLSGIIVCSAAIGKRKKIIGFLLYTLIVNNLTNHIYSRTYSVMMTLVDWAAGQTEI